MTTIQHLAAVQAIPKAMPKPMPFPPLAKFGVSDKRPVLKKFDGPNDLPLSPDDLRALGEHICKRSYPPAELRTYIAFDRMAAFLGELRRQQQGNTPVVAIGRTENPLVLTGQNLLLPGSNHIASLLLPPTEGKKLDGATLIQGGITALKWCLGLEGSVIGPPGIFLYGPNVYDVTRRVNPIMTSAHLGAIGVDDIILKHVTNRLRRSQQEHGTEQVLPLTIEELAKYIDSKKPKFKVFPEAIRRILLYLRALDLVRVNKDHSRNLSYTSVAGKTPESVFQHHLWDIPNQPISVEETAAKLFGRFPRKARILGSRLGNTLIGYARKANPDKFPKRDPNKAFENKLIQTYLPEGATESDVFTVEQAAARGLTRTVKTSRNQLTRLRGDNTKSGEVQLTPNVVLSWEKGRAYRYQLKRIQQDGPHATL